MNKETNHLTQERLKLGTNEDEMPTHLDLFSGIGGFALAAGWAGFKTIGFCDNEPYAQAVLKKHWVDIPIHDDIKTLDGTAYRGVTLLTGGFPCQPFSSSGKQRGKNDDRYLWPEMLRVIREARPTWIIGENVAGIVNMALDQVHTDLEAEGYEVESLIIPACGVDAIHKRDRVWIVANSNSGRLEGATPKGRNCRNVERSSCVASKGIMANSKKQGLEGWNIKGSEYMEGGFGQGGYAIQANWLPEPNVGRVAHGIPNRTHRLKGLGNAIVPQVAYQIIKGIRELL